MTGKPYSGKLNVRFDEGELEIEPSATTPALYSTPNPLWPKLSIYLTCYSTLYHKRWDSSEFKYSEFKYSEFKY